jgi:hypothetical protein
MFVETVPAKAASMPIQDVAQKQLVVISALFQLPKTFLWLMSARS